VLLLFTLKVLLKLSYFLLLLK